jgi:hypothetical protein
MRKMIRFIAEALNYMRLGVIVKVPLTPDNSAESGLFGLMANVNNYAENVVTQATSGTNVNITAAQLISGGLVLTTGATGGFTITLPSTATIIAALGPTIPLDGTYCEPIAIQNLNIGQTGTVTAGDAGTTLSGTMTIATNTTRKFWMTVTSPTAITITNTGSLAL